ncbi:hypothetical protein [Streptomyces sp. DT2A-34]|uniref:hypothetical protein n=1 Tax=unclassified Streptomyces TaxID=2593676 RepID=UPI00265C05BA|nr:hypothetical protein [Streptomyces sp. DT2A-34]MDO0917781.1 hypothetical protein [Streptomyces sp. DT2A-34]
MTSLSEYVMGAVNLIPVACNLWNLPGVARLRTRLRRLPAPAPSEPIPSVSSTSPAGVAAELLRSLPLGAAAHYEAPDGSKVTVWWITAPPAAGSGSEGYALW